MIIDNWYSFKLDNICKTIELPDTSDLGRYSVRVWQATKNLNGIATKYVGTHIDDNYHRYSVILIHDNQGLIGKGITQVADEWMEQRRGVIVILDVHQKHHCIEDLRLPCLPNKTQWIGYYLDFENKSDIPNRTRIEEMFIEELTEESEDYFLFCL
jgi:hypothetical protein